MVGGRMVAAGDGADAGLVNAKALEVERQEVSSRSSTGARRCPRRSSKPPAPLMAGSSTAEQKRFYFESGVAGRLSRRRARRPRARRSARMGPVRSARSARSAAARRCSRTARTRAGRCPPGLQPLRWPDPFPAESEWAMLVATYAKQIGRAVAFSLAAFRQASPAATWASATTCCSPPRRARCTRRRDQGRRAARDAQTPSCRRGGGRRGGSAEDHRR